MQNFSLETLDQLNRFGLQYCPLDPFKGQSYSLQKPHCFPWLIAEYKVAAKQTEKCVCQAANAGTAALMLFQTAARFASDKVQGRHVPPVVTITTTSNIIKVWIMYYAPKESDDAYVSSSQLSLPTHSIKIIINKLTLLPGHGSNLGRRHHQGIGLH